MNIQLVSGPASEPIDLATARLHLRLDESENSPGGHIDDTLVSLYITAARQAIEGYTNRRIGTQTVLVSFDAFATSGLVLPVAPVQSIVSVKYLDTSGGEQTLATDAYALDVAAQPAILRATPGTDWPTTQTAGNAVRVTAVVGYDEDASPEGVPAIFKAAILLLLGDLYAQREATPVRPGNEGDWNLPPVVRRLVDPYRIWLL